MSRVFTRLKSRRPVRWTTVLGLLLVPLTVAGVLLWGLWNPTDRLDSVTAAVVNNDEPVEVDGQTVPLGRLLAGELIDGGSGTAGGERRADAPANFTWVLTDESDADAGLDDGRFAAVVTIPENVSEAATSSSGEPEDAETATIDVRESDRGRLIDTALTGIVTSTATNLLNTQLGEQFVGGVFVGMNELATGIGEAADGAGELAEGGKQLADGAGELADGTSQLADGTGELAAGAGELSSGAGQLADGVGALSQGAGELAAGLNQFAAGARAFATGDGTAENPGAAGYAAGAAEYAGGVHELASGVEEYTGGINEILGGVTAGGAAVADQLRTARDLIENDTIPLPEDRKAAALATIDGVLAQLDGAGAQIAELEQAGVDLAAGAQQAAAGADGLAAGARDLAGGAEGLAVGAEQLSGGAGDLSSGTQELAGGASQLAGGTAELASGTAQLAEQTPQLADGAVQLADGVDQSAKGAKELSGGLAEAAGGIPSYSEDEREALAEAAITPVETEGTSDELFNSSGVPLFAGVALWAGALAAFMLLAPLWPRAREAARSTPWIALRSALPAAGLGALQGAIAGIVLPLALGYSAAQGTRFFGLAVLTGVAFALVVQGLSALLGGVGRFIAFALLVVAFAVGIVSTVPGPLEAIGDASPVGAALAGFQAVATGSSGAVLATVMLVLWAAGGLVLTALAVARARKA